MLKIFSKVSSAIKTNRRGFVSAVILCAGSSTRFSSEGVNKQMVLLAEKPVIVHTITSFEDCQAINEIVLVVRKEDTEAYKELVFENRFKKVKSIVVGGETRQLSALKGFKRISEKSRFVAIHDGARCLVTPEIIERVVDAAIAHNASSAATKATDTVKVVDEKGFVKKTLNRSELWNVQTPQAFEVKLYASCAYSAREKGLAATDDCSLIEMSGFKVKLIDTGRQNIKITLPEDVIIAEAILKKRGESEE